MLFRTVLFLFFLTIVNGVYPQNCPNGVNPPETVNGVNVTATSTGLMPFTGPYTSCVYTSPVNCVLMGLTGAFNYTFNFSSPVNNVVVVLTATGQNVDEVFTFTTNATSTTISDNGSCFSTISGNILSTGGGASPTGGGGMFTITGVTDYTTLTISGPGGEGGSVFSLCSNSIIGGCSSPDNNLIGNDTIICSSDFIPFTKTSPSYASYSWEDFNGNVLATTQSYIIPDSGSYIVKTLGVPPQCDGIDTLNVVFKSSPISIFEADTVCLGINAMFNNTTQITGGNITNTTWDFGDGNISNISSPTHLYGYSGSFNVQLSSVSSNNCSHDTTITVVVNDVPTASFTIDSDCVYDAPIFTESSSVANGIVSEWSWNFGDVLPNTIVQSTDQIPSYNYSQSGSYDVTLIVKTDEGCDDTLVQTTIRYPTPEVSFTSISACKNDSVTFTNTSSINAPDNITSWVWNFGDGSQLNNQFEKNHKYQQEGVFNVTLIASSNNGCVSSETSSISVYTSPICLFSSSSACEKDETSFFTNLSIINSGSIDNYEWDFGNGETSNLVNPSINYLQPGIYDVQLIGVSNFGCRDTFINSYEVKAKPQSDFLLDINFGCTPLCVQLTDNSVSNASSLVNHTWFVDGQEITNSIDFSTCFNNESTLNSRMIEVGLIVQNDLGCLDTLTIDELLEVYPNPLADFSVLNENDLDIYNLELDLYNRSEGADEYEWLFRNYSSPLFEPEISLPDSGTYSIKLIVSTTRGCLDSINTSVFVKSVNSHFVPNAFTPDGDGINDVFTPLILNFNPKSYRLSIFDRWGLLIFVSNQLDVGWEGSYNFKKCPIDVYEYRIEFETTRKEDVVLKGFVNLIR